MGDALAQQAADVFGLHLTPEHAAQFDTYARELAAWNAHTNLTAITTPDEVRVRHFLDSLSVAKAVALDQPATMIDVGTGAGFPGLPLAMVFPQLEVVLMEATGKKIAFLDHMIQTLGLPNARTLHARAEDAGHLPEHRAAYDFVVARAVARLPSLLEYLLPLAKVGGAAIAMKGRTAQAEARDSGKALHVLGGRLREIVTIQLPEVSEPHYLVVVDKTAATPPPYPRKPGTPTQKPIQ